MVFPEPWVKPDFSRSYIGSLIRKRKLGGNLLNQQRQYKVYESQNHLYDCYYSISKTKTCKMSQKSHKYTSVKLEERKLQKIGDSSNNDRTGIGKYSGQVSSRLRHTINFAKLLRTLFLANISGGYFFQMLPNLKRRRA